MLKNFRTTFCPAILNSYSIIFFLDNKIMAGILLVVSFFNVYSGLSGLISVMVAVALAYWMQMDRLLLKKGILSFNALLVGLGLGTYFEFSWLYMFFLILASGISLIITISLSGWFNKRMIPVLSIPFIISFWMVSLATTHLETPLLTLRNVYWLNELYSMVGNKIGNIILTIDNSTINTWVDLYLRSLSSVFFQNNLVTGLLIAIGLLLSSRIHFSLSLIGFVSAYLVNALTLSDPNNISYYNIGANYILVALAIGGFFSIPSRWSYLWTVLLMPITMILVLFFDSLLMHSQLPAFSLPFSLVVVGVIPFLQARTKSDTLILTPFQHYSPEENLYTYINNNKNRYFHFLYQPLSLPFWGEWTVSQAHDGQYTHKGEWKHAFDFVIADESDKTYHSDGLTCEDYYCYKKPVISPADGYVVDIIDNIEDNSIGEINAKQNWGNSIIIRHNEGLYSQLSHLLKGSFKVSKGSFVKKGDLLALCGNSGRSPEPHIHFQVQAHPFLGSRTVDYPFAYYFAEKNKQRELKQFIHARQGDRVSGINEISSISKAFNIQPNQEFVFNYNHKGTQLTEKWESFTDSYNNHYLHCKETDSTAYYINDGMMFYFTAFYGNRKSLLYYFYLSAYKVLLGDNQGEKITDSLPFNTVTKKHPFIWIHDFIAPFYSYIRVNFTIEARSETPDNNEQIELISEISMHYNQKETIESTARIHVQNNRITGFSFTKNTLNIIATCEDY